MKRRLDRVFKATKEANRDEIVAMLGANPAASMLDIGPHDGQFTMRAAAAAGASDVHGIELIDEHGAAARARGIAIAVGDVDDGLPYADGQFDLVLANQVIEHVRRTDAFLQEVRRVLQPGGIACISTNNLGSWHNVGALALGHQPMPMHVSDEVILGNPLNPERGLAHEDLGRTHLRLFTSRALLELAAYHGLDAIDVRHVGYYPLAPRTARAVARIDPRHAAYVTALFRVAEPAPRANRPPDA